MFSAVSVRLFVCVFVCMSAW